MKATYLAALLPVLLLGGCNDAEIEVCRYYVQQDLDSENYLSAIDRLEDTRCQNTYPNGEFNVDLGSAYLGKAGLTLPEVMTAMIDDTNNGDDQFSVFVGEVSNSATDTALFDLTDARTAFSNYLGMECKDIADPSSTQDGICLLTGFIDILKTSMAINAMTGGNVDDWIDGSDTDNREMARSSCALQYAYDHKNDIAFTTPYTKCETGVTVEDSVPVTFTASDSSTRSYNSLTIFDGTTTGYFLESESIGSTIFTEGYCQTDYSSCDDPSVSTCYVCPISQAGDDLSIQDFALDALNNGFDNIESIIASTESAEDDDLQQSIDEFKAEIKPEGCGSIPDGDPCFTMDDIIEYLNK